MAARNVNVAAEIKSTRRDITVMCAVKRQKTFTRHRTGRNVLTASWRENANCTKSRKKECAVAVEIIASRCITLLAFWYAENVLKNL